MIEGGVGLDFTSLQQKPPSALLHIVRNCEIVIVEKGTANRHAWDISSCLRKSPIFLAPFAKYRNAQPMHATKIAYLQVIASSNARRRPFEVYSLYSAANIVTLPDEVAKVFPRDFALHLDLDGFFPLFLDLLEATLKAFAKLVSGVFEGATDLGADPGGV